MSGLQTTRTLRLALACFILSHPAHSQSTARQPRLCACQREGEHNACIAEVKAQCVEAGPGALAIPMCAADLSGPLTPDAFMPIIKASAVQCRHPYQFTVQEMNSFLGATGASGFQQVFLEHQIDGAIMTELTVADFTETLKLPLGPSKGFVSSKEVFLKPGIAKNQDSRPGQTVKLQLGFRFNQVCADYADRVWAHACVGHVLT